MLNKTSRLISSARIFLRLYRLLLIHCIYVSVTKPTCPAFSAWLNSAWLNICSIRSLKATGKAIMLCSMALPSKLCATLHGQSNAGSMCDCNTCRSLDLSVFCGNSIRSCQPSGGYSNFLCIRWLGPSIDRSPQKNIRNFKHPKKIFEIFATPKNIPILYIYLKKRPQNT